jgi:hypothetical protein
MKLLSYSNIDFSKAYSTIALFQSGPMTARDTDFMAGTYGAEFDLDGDVSPLFPYINIDQRKRDIRPNIRDCLRRSIDDKETCIRTLKSQLADFERSRRAKHRGGQRQFAVATHAS